ncbi:unnamed protein product [Blepharisma stoltei]|uniref:Protein kinase domain-containing protein n=1 Tax=Blepharisma stoltei TaxID=1481888 RepID=A0AAU9JU45_9CILI|nr:unnamed protein product [Blepharisma stoltei]
MDGNSYFLILFSLTFLYGFSLAYAMTRIYKLHKFCSDWRYTKLFYVSIAVQVLIRLCTFAFMTWALPGSIEGKKVFFLLISIPDAVFLVSYFLLFLQMIRVFYFSHMENDLQMSLLVHFTKPRHFSATKILGVLTIIWLLVESGLYVLYFKGIVRNEDIQFELSSVNLLCSMFVFIFLIFLHINYSSTPFKSNTARDKLQRITSIMFLWTIARYIKGFYEIFVTIEPNIFIRNIHEIEKATLIQACSLVCMLILCEIICYITVLDYSFMAIFLFPDDEVIQHAGLFDHHGNVITEEDEERSLYQPRRSISETPNLLMDFNDITIISSLANKSQGLGELFKATYKGKDILYRKIEFPRMSGSVLEEINADIAAMKALDNSILVPFYGACFTLPAIGISTLYMKGGSLFSYLHESARILDIKEKIKLISIIARGLRDLHSQNKIHGHLSSHNILLDEQNEPKIADLGLEKVKKYAGAVLGYENKNAWSSPQIFREPYKTIIKAQSTDDVYSFGVIIWEIMTQQIPHDGKTLKILQQSVGLEGNILPIPNNLQPEIVRLLRGCWEFEPEKRPDFRHISVTLSGLLV